MVKNGLGSASSPRRLPSKRRKYIGYCFRCVGIALVLLTIVPIVLIEFNILDSRQDKDFLQLSHLVENAVENVYEELVNPLWAGPNKDVEEPTKSSQLQSGKEHHFGGEDDYLARGAAGLPMKDTPALVGASRGHIQCDVPVDDNIMTYWNDPQGKFDIDFVSPFKSGAGGSEEYFMTFEPDSGGWNNIRMSLEIIIVYAAVTGRTLVLPPKAPLYLLGTGKKNARSFGDFFSLHDPVLASHVKIITMTDFLKMHGRKLIPEIDSGDVDEERLRQVGEMCIHKKTSNESCEILFEVFRRHGYQPPIDTDKECLIFDRNTYLEGEEPTEDAKARVKKFCGEKRKPVYYNGKMADVKWVHWDANHNRNHHRLLMHFYTFLYFTDPVIDNHYKRFVRDFLHYKDDVYCAAWKVIKALNEESKQKNVPWSALHVRRGDLQYKKVKISAKEWYENTKEVWIPNEILYFATDERNKTFFDPFVKDYHHSIKFLDDYWDMAGLDKIDSSQLGMIDTIIASHGRAFAGTFFSTFTGYINRMRGYVGYSMMDSWYSYLPRKDVMREWKYPNGNYYAREWPLGWVGIDGDMYIDHEREVSLDEGVDRNKYIDHPLEISQNHGNSMNDEGGDTNRKLAVESIDSDLSRGAAGLPIEETPALIGAKRGHIECDVPVDDKIMVYWNEPQGQLDLDFVSPFRSDRVSPDNENEYFITFEPDCGGWNNIRMSLENIIVYAAATGRTLVLPPKAPMYLLGHGKQNAKNFDDYFKLDHPDLASRVKIISTAEFLQKYALKKVPQLKSGKVDVEQLKQIAKICVHQPDSPESCEILYKLWRQYGYQPPVDTDNECLIFDIKEFQSTGNGDSIAADADKKSRINKFCGERRKPNYHNQEMAKPQWVHWNSATEGNGRRLLDHFYTFMYFTNPVVDNHMKRLVRDFLHYKDDVYCAAWKVIKALNEESERLNVPWSALHVRRGDLQFKEVKIPAEEWYENTKDAWKPKEILYFATDERNKTFFDTFVKDHHHTVKFLDDYWELAGLSKLDSSYLGMIDTIIASHGRAFAGTWFSTFSCYINRMRGYLGYSMEYSWYGYLERKDVMRTWKYPTGNYFPREWPIGWVGIDGDHYADHERELPLLTAGDSSTS